MYKITKLQNQSNCSGNPAPTIAISANDAEWQQAYDNWIKGKPPTDSPEWKKGMFAITEVAQ